MISSVMYMPAHLNLLLLVMKIDSWCNPVVTTVKAASFPLDRRERLFAFSRYIVGA